VGVRVGVASFGRFVGVRVGVAVLGGLWALEWAWHSAKQTCAA